MLENGKKGLIAILTDITDLKIPRSRIETLQELPSGDTLSSQTPAHHEAANPATGTNVQSDGMNYRDYLEIAPEGIWAFDKDLKTTFVNAWMAGMLGFSPGEMIGKSLYTYLDNAGKTALKKYLKYLQEGRIVLDTRDFEIIKKDGSKLFSTISISPFVDKSGILHGALAVVNDITARKQAEDTLRLSEKYYRTIIETSPNGIVIFNPLGEIKMVNRQTSRYLGYDDPKDLDGKNIFNFISLNDVEKCQTLFRESSLNNKKISSIECTLIKKDSSGFCVDLVISLFGSQSENEEFFIGMITDVTERRRADIRVRKSEQKYRSLVQGISHIIFSADLNGKITYISPVVWKILGYSPDELLGKHFFALVSSDSRHMLGLRLKEAQAGKLAPADFQFLKNPEPPAGSGLLPSPSLKVTG